jgi:DNA-binding NarL/FixJ family response regulator
VTTSPEATTVVIADDQTLMRSGLRMLLDRSEGVTVVGEASDGHGAVQMVRERRPDVALMDIRMPGIDGIEATRRIVAEPGLATKILVLTTYDLDEYVYHAVRAGASGFLLKTAPPPQLIAAIRAVAAGDTLLAPEITRRLLDEYVRRPPPGGDLPAPLSALTDREVDVLRLIARGSSNIEIASALFVSEPTIKTHINRLFRKLGVRDRIHAVVLAYEMGLVRPGEGGAVDPGGTQ